MRRSGKVACADPLCGEFKFSRGCKYLVEPIGDIGLVCRR